MFWPGARRDETSQSTSSTRNTRRHARRGPRGLQEGGLLPLAPPLPPAQQASRVQGRGVCRHQPVQRQGPRRTGVRHRDLVDLIRVKPDLALAALQHRSGEALLQQKRDAHACRPCGAEGVVPGEQSRVRASEGAVDGPPGRRSWRPWALTLAKARRPRAPRCCGAVRLLHRVRMGCTRILKTYLGARAWAGVQRFSGTPVAPGVSCNPFRPLTQ